jgi:hypothetical protein
VGDDRPTDTPTDGAGHQKGRPLGLAIGVDIGGTKLAADHDWRAVGLGAAGS